MHMEFIGVLRNHAVLNFFSKRLEVFVRLFSILPVNLNKILVLVCLCFGLEIRESNWY